MTMTLTFDDELARVQIEVTGLSASTYDVERSTNELFWQPVRGGLSVDPVSGEIELFDYEFESHRENFYRVVDLEESPDSAVIEQDSITPELETIWLKNIRFPFLNRPVTVTDFSDIGRASRTGVFEVKGRSVPIGVSDLRASRGFTIEVMTETAEQAMVLDLTLAAGSEFFIHIPAGCPVPGGYVEIGDTTEARRSTRGARRYFNLPCRIVAPPGPDVVGGTMTYGALLNLYGGYNNLLAANQEYADLLALMASPEDLVVL